MAPRILTYKRVADCETALEAARLETLDALSDLFEQRRELRETRRRSAALKRNVGLLTRRLEERVTQAEVLTDLIRSSPDGETIPHGGPVQYLDAGKELLEQFSTLLEHADSHSEESLQKFFQELAQLREKAIEWFDYRGARLLYELSELLSQSRKARPKQMRGLLQKARNLRRKAADWFK